jgi:hypothetical protein
MKVTEALDEYQATVNAEPDSVREARRRRDLFRDALTDCDDVNGVKPSGSLARGTQKAPIHDVDLIIEYDASVHPGWGNNGDSAAEALDHTSALVNQTLGAANGTHAREVRLASPRNHAVKCFLDDPDDPDAFTVDAMPALRQSDGTYLVPEKSNTTWIHTNPQYLIDRAADRHTRWNKFAGLVRMLKAWAAVQDVKIKSLVMEILALELLPERPNRPEALKEFFVRAAYKIENGEHVVDPAGLCGEVQPDLDYDALERALRTAADKATAAIDAVNHNDHHKAIRLWGEIFGDGFPTAPAPAIVVPVVPRPVKDSPQG